jgi:glycosyltransferase involved in cell wall biosynthesis
MKISVVTISYNQKKYLRQCMDSILGQTHCDLEYIVVDPGSTDGSRELIESYGDRIIKLFAPDKGPADGLNQGFKLATGDVYGFINSDDYLLPDALSHVSQYFSTKGLGYFVTGQGYTENAQGGHLRIHPQKLTAQTMLHRSAVMFQQATFFSAQSFKDVGGFNTENDTCWDYELFLRFLLNGVQHEVIAQDLAAFRLHDQSISGTGRLNERYFKELDKIFAEIFKRDRGAGDKVFTLYLRVKRELLRRFGFV